ncbi:glutamine transport system permease [Escherichia coli]|nr:glutamine transport system permease [Escherichia coli]
MQFDWSAIWPAIPLLIEGAKMTLWISVLGLAGGLVIGLLAGFARTFGGWIANHVALVFIEVIRGTPIVVQVMLFISPCRWRLTTYASTHLLRRWSPS